MCGETVCNEFRFGHLSFELAQSVLGKHGTTDLLLALSGLPALVRLLRANLILVTY